MELTQLTLQGWTTRFLERLADTANVRAACEYAGITRQGAYKRRKESATFAAAWDRALEDAVELLELVARQRATEQSDTLIMFLLKAHRPEKYRETIKQQQEHSGTVRIEYVNDWRKSAHGGGSGEEGKRDD